MHTEEHMKIETQGVKEGINPMFGTWEQDFEIEPVSYQNQRDRKNEFRKAVQAQLTPKYVFFGDKVGSFQLIILSLHCDWPMCQGVISQFQVVVPGGPCPQKK